MGLINIMDRPPVCGQCYATREAELYPRFTIILTLQDGESLTMKHGNPKTLKSMCAMLYCKHHPRYVEVFDRESRKTKRYSF